MRVTPAGALRKPCAVRKTVRFSRGSTALPATHWFVSAQACADRPDSGCLPTPTARVSRRSGSLSRPFAAVPTVPATASTGKALAMAADGLTTFQPGRSSQAQNLPGPSLTLQARTGIRRCDVWVGGGRGRKTNRARRIAWIGNWLGCSGDSLSGGVTSSGGLENRNPAVRRARGMGRWYLDGCTSSGCDSGELPSRRGSEIAQLARPGSHPSDATTTGKPECEFRPCRCLPSQDMAWMPSSPNSECGEPEGTGSPRGSVVVQAAVRLATAATAWLSGSRFPENQLPQST